MVTSIAAKPTTIIVLLLLQLSGSQHQLTVQFLSAHATFCPQKSSQQKI